MGLASPRPVLLDRKSALFKERKCGIRLLLAPAPSNAPSFKRRERRSSHLIGVVTTFRGPRLLDDLPRPIAVGDDSCSAFVQADSGSEDSYDPTPPPSRHVSPAPRRTDDEASQ